MKLWTIVLAAALAVAVAPAQVTVGEPAFPLITVTGNGRVFVEPNVARVRMGVLVQRPTAREAQAEANAVVQRFLQQVRPLLRNPQDIQTTRITLSPVYDQRPPQRDQPFQPRIVAYQAQNVLTVVVHDFERIGQVIDVGIAAGANQVESIDFGLLDDAAARAEALRLASLDARLKAESIARALGVVVGPIWRIQEGFVARPMMQDQMMMRGVAAPEMAPTPVEPGQLELSAQVQIQFRISPG
jgi:uncharacterized protein